jgi:hypothetical protein
VPSNVVYKPRSRPPSAALSSPPFVLAEELETGGERTTNRDTPPITPNGRVQSHTRTPAPYAHMVPAVHTHFRSDQVVFTAGETSLRRISLSAQRHCAEYLCTPPDVIFTSSEFTPPNGALAICRRHYAECSGLLVNLACRGPPQLLCKLRN